MKISDKKRIKEEQGKAQMLFLFAKAEKTVDEKLFFVYHINMKS